MNLFVAVLGVLPAFGCASTPPERPTVVDVSTKQMATTGPTNVPVAAEPSREEPSLVDKLLISDADGDGIPNDVDKCWNVPEDFDAFEDKDGCPDPDNDADGVADAYDKCPNEPETKNGFEDEDGCPDSTVDMAKAVFRQGTTAYSQGDYAQARKYFEEAYKIDPADALLYNLARTADKQGDRQGACQYYRRWRSTSGGASATYNISQLETCP